MASTSKRLLVIVLIIVFSGAMYMAFLKPAATGSENPMAGGGVTKPADEVYLSSLTNLQGQQVDMDQDKLVFLNIWATWCGPCNLEMPGIQRLYDKYKGHEKIAFYIVSDEEAETVDPFINKKGYELPFYRFTGSYPTALDGNAIPRTYIIYKGKILVEETGASQWDRAEVIQMIDKQLEEI